MKQTGFIEPVITPDQYVQGDLRIGAVEEVLDQDGDWGEWDIIFDVQHKTFDTKNCTGFNTAQSISKILKRKYNLDFKPSPRWIGIVAGTDWNRGGNDPQTVCEAIRKNGLIPDEMLPWSDDITSPEEYYSFKGADEAKCREAGKKWLNEFEFKHDWVTTSANTLDEIANNIKNALKFSPVGAAVSAWLRNAQGLYERFTQDNHWTEIRAWRGGAVFDDSYEPFEKEATPDFKFMFLKRYIVNKKVPVTPERAQTILQVLWSFIKNNLTWIFGEWLENYNTVPARPIKPVEEPAPETPPVVPPPEPKYHWLTPTAARHSVRVICDEEGLTVAQKNLISSVINCESGYRFNAKNENKKDGRVFSTDWGICQINDYWHIGPGKTFPSVDFVINHPEECVRWMIKMFKAGKLNLWVCYSSKLYQQFEA